MTPPNIELAFEGELPAEYTSSNSVSIASSVATEFAEDNTKVDCRRDDVDQDRNNCASPIEFSQLVDGVHTLEIVAKYSAKIMSEYGELPNSTLSHTWTVDTIPPVLMVTSGPGGTGLPGSTSSTSTARFVLQTNEMLSRSISALDGEAFEGCGSTFSLDVAYGRHVLEVRGVDRAGNEGASVQWHWSYGRTWKALAATANSMCGIDDVGGLWCWGNNSEGQLGRDTQNESAPIAPGKVSGNETWLEVEGSYFYTCALSSSRKLFAGESETDRVNLVMVNKPGGPRLGDDHCSL